MRLHLSPFTFLRRHAWGLGVLVLVVVGWFAAIGWVAGKLNTDLGRTYKAAPVVEDHAHRAE